MYCATLALNSLLSKWFSCTFLLKENKHRHEGTCIFESHIGIKLCLLQYRRVGVGLSISFSKTTLMQFLTIIKVKVKMSGEGM